jgi:hypothetical protein
MLVMTWPPVWEKEGRLSIRSVLSPDFRAIHLLSSQDLTAFVIAR